ncbi:hypothetical protein GV792_04895 [Nocardia cyriacigeorgica]|uniref:hypothetical protein n=1 Tax=Nocardia cyriacigeorgica TaxID=135487 RepID=UPI0013BC5879|nr:hypothetical protein [Nocardia cyriacigeorgica]NEW49381.1 hypothetical protein [Nocardia cyriacigeorgica]
MPWDYYGQVIGTESRAMMLTHDEHLSLDALRAFVSVCEGMPGAALVSATMDNNRLRLTAEVRETKPVIIDGPRLCADCDGSGLAFAVDAPCPTCKGTGHPLPAGDPTDHPTMPMPVVAADGADRG